MRNYRHLRSILALPVVVLGVIPALLLITTNDIWPLPQPSIYLRIASGSALILCGLCLVVSTVRLFMRFGDGTLAPWEPTQQLVVRGIYRHVRNPMHTGVFLVLTGEGLVLKSTAILLYAGLFMLGHLFYIPLAEEKGLESRFGEDYRRYRQNVPRWIPRLRPWQEDK